MKRHKLKIHYGEQNTDDWKALKVGKFSSSTAWQLFENPSKQTRSKTAMKELKNDGWQLNKEVADHRPDNSQMNYAIGYLLDYGFGRKEPFVEGKADLKAAFKDKAFDWVTFQDFGLTEAAVLVLRACYAIEKINPLAGSCVGLAHEKALEVIHNELRGGDISKIKAIEWGNEYESLASQHFERKTCEFVDKGEERVKFAEIIGLESGSSPDDVIDGLTPAEYKCPFNKKIHYEHTEIRSAAALLKYSKQKYFQVQHQIWTMHAQFGFWNSFDPRLLKHDRFKHKALHTIKIKLNARIARQFEEKTKKAVEIRDAYISNFEHTNDRELWDF